MNKTILGLFVGLTTTFYACSHRTPKVEVQPPNPEKSPDPTIQGVGDPAPTVTEVGAEGKSGSKAPTDKPVDPPADKPKDVPSDKTPDQSTGGKNFQFYYEDPSQNKKDCLVSRNGGAQVSYAPCTNNQDMGFQVKGTGPNKYQIISGPTGKCIAVNSTGNNNDENAQALTLVGCADGDAQNSTFTFVVSDKGTKIQVNGMCLKMGAKVNIYLADCAKSWTWFSKSAL